MTYLNLVIQLKKPCPALKFGPNADFSEVASKSKEKRERSEEKKMNSIIDTGADRGLITKSPLKSAMKNRSRSSIPERACFSSGQAPAPEYEARVGGPPTTKSGPSLMPSAVRSPFNMTSNIDSEVQSSTFQNQGN